MWKAIFAPRYLGAATEVIKKGKKEVDKKCFISTILIQKDFI